MTDEERPSDGGGAAAPDFRNLRWEALLGVHRVHGRRAGGAAAYDPVIGPWAAVRSDDQDAWDDLRGLVGRAEVERSHPRTPNGWQLERREEYLLMVDDRDEPTGDRGGSRRLDEQDLDAVAELAAVCGATMFSREAFALGTFHGVEDHGRLVALAGTRGATDRAQEIVAVATVPDRQGEGLATRAVSGVRTAIRAQGRVPYLQVLPENVRAVRLYERMGFRVHHRTTVDTLRAG